MKAYTDIEQSKKLAGYRRRQGDSNTRTFHQRRGGETHYGERETRYGYEQDIQDNINHDIRSRMNDLKDLKVSDIIRSEAFAKELRQQLDIEEAVQTKMIASGRTRRTTLDRLRERGVWNERDMAVLWPRVMDKTLVGYSAAERKAIGAVCVAAYKRTMKKAVAEEKSEKGGEG